MSLGQRQQSLPDQPPSQLAASPLLRQQNPNEVNQASSKVSSPKAQRGTLTGQALRAMRAQQAKEQT